MKNFEKISKKKTELEILNYIKGHLDYNKYHLHIECSPQYLDIDTMELTPLSDKAKYWALYQKHRFQNDYFDERNKPILSSKENNLEELYKFAMLHEKKDICDVTSQCTKMVCLLNILLLIVVLYSSNSSLDTYLVGLMMGNAITSVVYYIVYLAGDINNNIDCLERMEARREDYRNSIAKMKEEKNDDVVDAVRFCIDEMTNEEVTIKKDEEPKIKPVEPSKVHSKPNVPKKTKKAENGSKTLKKAGKVAVMMDEVKPITIKSKKELDKLSESIQSVGVDFAKAGTDISKATKEAVENNKKYMDSVKKAEEPPVKRKPGRPKKSNGA